MTSPLCLWGRVQEVARPETAVTAAVTRHAVSGNFHAILPKMFFNSKIYLTQVEDKKSAVQSIVCGMQ